MENFSREGVLRRAGNGYELGDPGAIGLRAPLRRVLDARLARLDEEHLRLLRLAAVTGQDAPLALWGALAEADQDGPRDTIERAVDAHLLAESPDGVRVRSSHALIRETLHAGAPSIRCRRRRRPQRAVRATTPCDSDATAAHRSIGAAGQSIPIAMLPSAAVVPGDRGARNLRT